MGGFFDGFLNGAQSPLFLGGANLLMGGGPQGMMEGMRTGAAFQDRQRKQQQEEAAKQSLTGVLGGMNLKPEEQQFLLANPETALGLLQGMYANRFDPMAGLRKRQMEANVAQTEGENALLPARRRMMEAQAAQGQQGKYMEVNGRILRLGPNGPEDVTPSNMPQKSVYTPAETAVDKKYATTYDEDVLSGGLADVQKNITQLKTVYDDLGKKNLTGWFTGSMPDFVNSVVNPAAVDSREKVEEVVQRNLRLILGAQFTNEEGKRLIARAYNPKLDEGTNRKRLGNLVNAMQQALRAKQEAAAYYEQNGTLKGYRGRTDFSARDFEDAIDAPDKTQGRVGQAPPKPGDVIDGWRYKGGNPADPSSYERM